MAEWECWKCRCFSLNEMTCPLITAFVVSQSINGETSGELFSSIRDVHSLERKLLKSLSARSEALNCHLRELRLFRILD